MKPSERKVFFSAHREKLTREQMADLLGVGLPTIRNYERELGPCMEPTALDVEPEVLVNTARKVRKLSESARDDKRRIKYLEDENEKLERALEASLAIGEYKPEIKIPKPKKSKQSESVMVAVLSDVHVEKEIKRHMTSGVNEYNLDIARERVERYFQNLVKMLKKEQADTPVPTLVLALLGDLVDGDIHEELLETSLLEPMYAVKYAYDLIAAGIQYLLNETDVDIIVPCIVGNHSRTTKETRKSTEAGHSTETLLYFHLETRFAREERITFRIEPSIHHYMEIYGYTIRFMHGHHGLRYQGGTGGIAVPLGRILPRWNSVRYADFTVMGHWHNIQDVMNTIVNGSVIGFDPYALSIAVPNAPPEQVYFFINSKYGRSGHNKIFLF